MSKQLANINSRRIVYCVLIYIKKAEVEQSIYRAGEGILTLDVLLGKMPKKLVFICKTNCLLLTITCKDNRLPPFRT